jgi:serine O-acetyltransferase
MFKRLREDIRAAKSTDPAAPSSFLILIAYPSIQATCNHRIEHWLWSHGCRGFARWLSQCTRFWTGIEIHPAAQLGRRIFIDHGMGVIIGETAVVGDDVTIYQGATLGGTGNECGKRHPTIEEGAIIGVGAAVLGNITVGARSRVGGGAVVVHDVPPDCTVVGIPGHIVRQEGKRVGCSKVEELMRHENLPDPVVDALTELDARLCALEAHCARSNGLPVDSAEKHGLLHDE